MTRPDFGAERPEEASETRRLGERSRTRSSEPMPMSGTRFVIALVVIAALIAAAAVLLR